MIDDLRVAILQAQRKSYPHNAPFCPREQYPEYPFGELSSEGWVYDSVRETLHYLGLDDANHGTSAWNPFGEFIRPGDKVVIKPNLVLDFNASGETTDCLITHASVIRPIVDYVHIALKGQGRITIADAPHGNADFVKIRSISGLDRLQEFYSTHGVDIGMLDLRKYEYGHGPAGFLEKRKHVNRDPEGYVEIDLGEGSAFVDIPYIENLYGADYDRREIRSHHNRNSNKYLVAKTFLTADVIINVPKLKTHKKIGTTLNLKGLVGINGDKNYLPHFRIGDPPHGGDEFPALEKRSELWKSRAKRLLIDLTLGNNDHKKIRTFKIIQSILSGWRNRPAGDLDCGAEVASGNWYGNETVYRTVYDLSKIIFMADKNGIICEKPQRRFFSIIDGIVAGEKEGPLAPSPKPCGVIIGGFNFVATDLLATRLMGFEPARMAMFSRLKELPPNHPLRPVSPNEIRITSNVPEWNRNIFDSDDKYLDLIPHSGWRNYLEIGRIPRMNTSLGRSDLVKAEA